jgi:hypothetical protein
LTPDELRVIICLFFLEDYGKEAEMALERSSFESLNYSKGFHPPDSPTSLEDPKLSEEFDSQSFLCFPSELNVENRCSSYRDYEVKCRVLEHVLKNFSERDLPGKEHIGLYMRHKYRCNFKPKTLFTTEKPGQIGGLV